MRKQAWLALRAAAAVALLIGFYVLALGLAAGLLSVPYFEITELHRLHPQLALGCLVGAGLIVWAVLPRGDAFVPPGPRLTAERHPRLFATIDEVARATGQSTPAEVYLVADVNAFVAARGGVMGMGSRRVMGIGLALLQTMTVDEVRAVIAHEFGHFHGGDIALGPWIHKTRAAMGRTIEALKGRSYLQLPFEIYGNAFLRITHAISRQQEYGADALAARVTGAAALASGLSKAYAMDAAFGIYLQEEIDPAVREGFLPPWVEGFDRFLSAPSTGSALAKFCSDSTPVKSSVHDTHPSLSERLAALGVAPAPPSAMASADNALALLDDPERVATELVEFLVGAARFAKLESVGWDDLVERSLLPAYRRLVESCSVPLGTVTVAQLAEHAGEIDDWRDAVADAGKVEGEGRRGFVRTVLGASMTLLLLERGYRVHMAPGEPVTARMNDETVNAHELVRALFAREVTAEQWRIRVAELGIADAPLASITSRAAAPSSAPPRSASPAA